MALNWLKKISLIACGLIVTFILLESALWAAGFIYLKNHRVKYSNHGDNRYSIVCIGDSFTMGIGAASGDDYPSQLEKILNAKGNKVKFRVINAGLGGGTTSIALKALNSLIMSHDPKILIVMIGTNDDWNYTGLNLACLPINSVPPIIRLESMISRSRTYRLAKIGFINLRATIHKPVYEVKKSEIELENEELAMRYYRQHDLNMAADYFNKVLLINPTNASAYNILAHIFREQGKYEKAMDYSIKILDMNTADEDVKQAAYLQLLCLYQPQKKYDEKIEEILRRNIFYADFENSVMEIYKKEISKDLNMKGSLAKDISNEKAQNKLSNIRKELIEKIMRYNLEEIVRIAKVHKIKLIFCSYPEYKFPAIAHMKETARRFGFVYIDIMPVFKDILSRESRDKYFVPDGHCTSSGYKIMADVIADRILSEL